ncbi:MAG: arsenate reductase (glutaredoxin) [Burkholderiales bacterium]|nr:arsenate reductase (glutaredoxin) [Burkholderiales bacterium]
MITIYHYPRCSKSREALALVEEFAKDKQIALHVVNYFETPFDRAALTKIVQQLADGSGQQLSDLVRSSETAFVESGLTLSDEEAVLQLLADQPALVQRPIVVAAGKAMIARPATGLHNWLQQVLA